MIWIAIGFAVIIFAVIYFPFRKGIHNWFSEKKYKGNKNLYMALIIALVVVITVVVFLTTNDISDDSGVAGSNIAEKEELLDELEAANQGVEIGTAIPAVKLKDTDDNEVTLADYSDKLIVLSFWNTWCKYCAKQLPIFERLKKENSEAEVFLINMNEPEEIVREYKKTEQIDFDILIDENGEIGEKFNVLGTPNNYFIYKGILCANLPGAIELTDLVGTIEECKLISTDSISKI